MPQFCYGPFMSRRLGLSLGVNILGEQKRCTFNCVYCEIGRTAGNCLVPPSFIVDIPTTGFREEISPILSNLRRDLDSVTVGYNGEPTLNPHLGKYVKILNEIRDQMAPSLEDKFPLFTIFTNSSTVSDPNVRHALSQFDLIIVKLDAGSRAGLNYVNRPHAEVPPIEIIVQSLRLLKEELSPNHILAIQSLFFEIIHQGIPVEVNITAWINQVLTIQPSIIQLYSIARRPAEPDVLPVTREVLNRIKNELQRRIQAGSDIDVQVF